MLVIDLGKLRQGVQDFFDGCKDSLISTEKSLEKSFHLSECWIYHQ